ncbi:MAG: alpha/beta fold hydrolase, partial [bacterium]|nr:alpha/beta fold hydrolase [bacterium]
EELKRPQNPKKPYPYNEEEVTVQNKAANLTLAGTLTTPKSGGPFPVVLLITGSGPQNRDEEVMGHKPFLVWADTLTRQGVAVLRLDDRGTGKSTGQLRDATTKDFAGDVLAAVEFLKKHNAVDPKRIGLLGHSEGGVIAPIVAAQSNDVAFIVMLAGTGIDGAEILLLQNELLSRAAGTPEDEIKSNSKISKKVFHVVKNERNLKSAKEKIVTIINEAYAQMSDEVKKKPGVNLEALQRGALASLAPWLRYFICYDPATALKKIKCPVLALLGAKDLQVTPKENHFAIKKALTEAGNKNFTVKVMPGLNHLFQVCETGAPTEYAIIEETVNPAALELVSKWILKQVDSK